MIMEVKLLEDTAGNPSRWRNKLFTTNIGQSVKLWTHALEQIRLPEIQKLIGGDLFGTKLKLQFQNTF